MSSNSLNSEVDCEGIEAEELTSILSSTDSQCMKEGR